MDETLIVVNNSISSSGRRERELPNGDASKFIIDAPQQRKSLLNATLLGEARRFTRIGPSSAQFS